MNRWWMLDCMFVSAVGHWIDRPTVVTQLCTTAAFMRNLSVSSCYSEASQPLTLVSAVGMLISYRVWLLHWHIKDCTSWFLTTTVNDCDCCLLWGIVYSSIQLPWSWAYHVTFCLNAANQSGETALDIARRLKSSQCEEPVSVCWPFSVITEFDGPPLFHNSHITKQFYLFSWIGLGVALLTSCKQF